MLYRVFPLIDGAALDRPGGPLYVPRERQGAGRHDQPYAYGALYLSRLALSAVAERIQAFRGQTLTDDDLRFEDGSRYALAVFDEDGIEGLIDLDDPAELSRRTLRPSRVATRQRTGTRALALRIFDEGAPGFVWWSTLEASWPNATLFAERAVPRLRLAAEPEPLSVQHSTLRAAAEAIGVRLE
jgi:hypothetical protein